MNLHSLTRVKNGAALKKKSCKVDSEVSSPKCLKNVLNFMMIINYFIVMLISVSD